MTLEKTLIRRVVLALLGALALGSFAIITGRAGAPTPSSALLITVNSKAQHALQIIDPRTAKVVGSVPISGGAYAHEVAVSADGKFAFVTITDYATDFSEPRPVMDGYISVIDLAAQKELRRVPTGPDSLPHGIGFAGGKVYFTAEGYQVIGRYDPASNRIDWMFGTGQPAMHMLAVGKDGSRIFAPSIDTNSVIAIEPREYRGDRVPHPMMEVVIPVGKHPEGIAMSPDEKEVWALNREDGSVSIIDVVTRKVKETLNLKTKEPIRVGFTPDGKRALIIDRRSGELLVLDAITRKEIRLMKVGSDLHCVLVAPDGSRAYVSGGHGGAENNAEGGNEVAVIDLKTLELMGRIVVGEDSDGMAWAETR